MFNFIAVTPDGHIRIQGTVQSEDAAIAPDNCTIIPCDNPHSFSAEDHYYNGSEVIPLPDFPAAVSKRSAQIDGVDKVIISSLPEAVALIIDGTEYVINGGRLELTSDVSAVYRITADHWPYKPWSTEIIFTEQL